MKRMMTFLVALATAAMLVSNAPPAAAAWIEYFFDFDQSLTPFGTFLNTIPSEGMDSGALTLNPSCYVGQITGGLTGMNNGCAELTLGLDGSYVSLMAPLKGQGITINVEFDAHSLDNHGAVAAMVYAGAGKPSSLNSFQQVGPLLTQGWTHYGYRALLDGVNPVIAVGITRIGDGPSFVQHAGIDNLQVRFLDD